MTTKSMHPGSSNRSTPPITAKAAPVERVRPSSSSKVRTKSSPLPPGSAPRDQGRFVPPAAGTGHAVAAPRTGIVTCALCQDDPSLEGLPYRIVLRCSHQEPGEPPTNPLGMQAKRSHS